MNGSFGSTITKTVTLTITFPSGDPLVVTFYVTPLDSTCDVVLGYNWLHRYNPLVNWSENSVAFRHTATGEPSALQSFYPVDDALSIDSSMSAEDPLSAADFSFGDPPPLGDRPEPPSFAPPLRKSRKKPSYPFEPIYEYPPGDHFIISSSPKISVISAAAYLRACKEPGAHQFSMRPDPGTSLREAKVQPADVSDIPPEYRDYADVFSDTLSEVLPDHRPYDHKIELEDGAPLPKLGPVYSLSQTELKALREFIDDNLATGFITSSQSSIGAPVLFVRKKTGDLRLCVDFRGLNKITKKDRYPLPLITDLLDTARSAKIYTKLDIRHAYHLIRIAEGDEWKTSFHTRYGSFEWRVMPEGLTNAPATFQRFVHPMQ